MRAVSVPINQVSAVSGFISPGDRVDIVLTHTIADISEEPILTTRRFSETILGNVRLLAVEQTVDAGTGKPRAGQTVTLELSPRQAEMVTLATSMQRAEARMSTAELKFFAIVLQLQAQTGGNLAETLSNLSKILRERKKMADKVKALSSEAKASAMR